MVATTIKIKKYRGQENALSHFKSLLRLPCLFSVHTIFRIACMLLVFGPAIALAQNVKLNRGKPVERKYLAQVPYEDLKGKIIIPVEIQGNTYRFLFDTGAPNLITHALSQQIDSKEINSIFVRDANGNKQKMEVVTISLIGIGGVQFEDIPTIVNNEDSSFILDCFGVDGIIGSNMVRKSVIQLDSENSVFRISNSPEHFVGSALEGIKMDLSDAQSSPYIWILLKGGGKASEYVLFDTGMQGFYDMSVKNYSELRALDVFDESMSGVGIKSIGLFDSSEANQHYRIRIPSIEIGDFNFKNVPTVTMDAERSRIGSEILKYGKVSLDFRNSKFYFEPYEDNPDLHELQLGFSPTVINNELVVGIVWDSELSRSIDYGDKILIVNGLDVSSMDPCEFFNKPSPFESDTELRILFEDAETHQKIELELIKE